MVPVPFGQFFVPPRRVVPPRISVKPIVDDTLLVAISPPIRSVFVVPLVTVSVLRSATLYVSVATSWFDIGFLWNPYKLARWVSGRSEEIRVTAVIIRRERDLWTGIATIDDDIH
jgi:hypothetical protein